MRFRTSAELFCGFLLSSARGLLARRGRSVALFEAGTAAAVAPFLEGRREVIAAAIAAGQLFRA